MRCWWARRSIRRAFADELPPRAARRLFDHLRGCEDCRGIYNRVFFAERALTDTPYPNPSERELGLVGALATAPVATRPKVVPWLLGAVPALGVAALILLMARPTPDSDPWQARGEPDDFHLRVICAVLGTDGSPTFEPVVGSPGPGERGDCPRSGTLMLAYRANSAGRLWVRVVADGKTRWLTDPSAPIEIESSSRDRRLPVRIDLGDYAADSLRLETLFSRDLLPPEQVREAPAARFVPRVIPVAAP